MILPVSSVVTIKTLCEFEILKKSIEYYHQCQWSISCDKETELLIKNKYDNVECLQIIKDDNCDHNYATDVQKDNWMSVMMTKFDAVEYNIDKFGYSLFLDSDMVFVNPIEEKVLAFFDNEQIDAAICQHMTNDPINEAQHGLYNGGMFHIRNKTFLNEWKKLSLRYKELGLYYEQQPLEYIQRNFYCINLPINYNIGWWRFNRPQTQKRLELLNVENNKIMFGNKPAINFHVHTKRKLDYQNFGNFLVKKMIFLFENSDNTNYKNLMSDIQNDK